MQVIIHAPAKINLTLDIVGVRPDGYHLLESVFQSVSVYDKIVVKTKWGKGITLIADGCDCPVEKNTAYKAAVAFFRYTGIKKGVKITIDKHIPQQAGMGGGSADAAGVLWALNTLFNTRLTLEQLCEIGLSVGADVPFCLVGGTAFVTGIGERVRSLPALPDCYIVVVQPDRGISTKEAYAAVDKAEIAARPDNAAALAALEEGDLAGVCRQAINVFESATDLRGVQEIRRRMEMYKPLCSQMTGSGSCVFAIFDDRDSAMDCQMDLQQEYDVAFVCRPCNGIAEE